MGQILLKRFFVHEVEGTEPRIVELEHPFNLDTNWQEPSAISSITMREVSA